MKVCGPANGLNGTTTLPGDKSISHRALMHAALSPGTSQIRNILRAGVTDAMTHCLQQLGVLFKDEEDMLVVQGGSWQQPDTALDCGNSGTTMRLLLGALADKPFTVTLIGTSTLQRRPMQRVAKPLRQMGAYIEGEAAPLIVRGRALQGISHSSSVASAQVKSALLLAALRAKGATTIIQPTLSRDHSERMLRALGVDVRSQGSTVTLIPSGKPLPSSNLSVPGDFSSAAFVIAAAILVPDSEVRLQGIGVNPTRTGLLDALHEMGANIHIEKQHEVGGEPVADIIARHSTLRAIQVEGNLVTRMIDEFPIFAVLASQAEGTTTVRQASELRLKESDRISVITSELRKLGVTAREYQDGFSIHGPGTIIPATVDSHTDHRLAMSLAIAGMLATGETSIERAEVLNESFPGFRKRFEGLGVIVS